MSKHKTKNKKTNSIEFGKLNTDWNSLKHDMVRLVFLSAAVEMLDYSGKAKMLITGESATQDAFTVGVSIATLAILIHSHSMGNGFSAKSTREDICKLALFYSNTTEFELPHLKDSSVSKDAIKSSILTVSHKYKAGDKQALEVAWDAALITGQGVFLEAKETRD